MGDGAVQQTGGVGSSMEKTMFFDPVGVAFRAIHSQCHRCSAGKKIVLSCKTTDCSR